MKYLLKPALIFLFAVLGFTGCIIESTPTSDGWAHYDVKYYTITQWMLHPSNRLFVADVSAPAITTDVLYNGVIVGYIIYGYNTRDEVHIPLPYDIYHNEIDKYGVLASWTETVSFDVMPGRITFYYEPSDFITSKPPPPCTFKVVAMW
jgi:hypothetical protein